MSEKIVVGVLIDANPQKAWSFYNQPEHITQWNYASDEWCCPSAEVDLKPGGKMKSRMEAKDGSLGFDFEGVYDEVTEHQKVAYTLLDKRKVTTEFIEAEGQTKVVTTFDADKEAPIEMQQQGWQAILNNFKNYVESN